MRRRSLLSTLALPLLLAVLVATLGVLQYRWLGQASEADRVGMRRSIDERARQFSTDLDREISATQTALSGAGDSGPRMAEQLDSWRKTARFPGLVRAIYSARFNGRDVELSKFSETDSTYEAVEWPSPLEAVRERLIPMGTYPDRDAVLMALATVVPSVPALITPATRSSSLAGNLASLHTIVEYDRDVLRTVVLPALAHQHFSGDNGDAYRLAVFDEHGSPFFASDESAATIQPNSADATTPILRARPELTPEQRSITFVAERTPPPQQGDVVAVELSGRESARPTAQMVIGGTARAPALRRELLTAATWTLRLQHPAGSIDAAVAAGRRRNLWVNFGMLGILVAGCTLIVLNARRAEQLAARQMEFVAAVSHELRTPVAVMRSAAQNLSAGVVLDAEQARRYGALIEAEGRRLTDTVEQVLEFATVSQAPRTAMTALDPAAIVRRTVDSHRPLIESQKFSVDVTIGDDLPKVIGQADALGRAVQNLIGNAVKYAASGRWVGIDVKRAEEAGREEIQIAVSDRGPGVDAQDLPHVFEPFYRGRRAIDDQIQGSGLGLSLVARIVESQGGRVSVRSTTGSGATFTIHLPAAAHAFPSSN